MTKPMILYVPGLGRKYDGFRSFCLRMWTRCGVPAKLVPMNWTDGGEFSEKYQRLRSEIAGHERVIIIGESAGAAMVLVTRHDAPSNVQHIVTVCGVTQYATPISPSLQQRAPALVAARAQLHSLPTATHPITSIVAAIDPVIARRYGIATGAQVHVAWSIGHLLTILLLLTFYAPWLIRRSYQTGV